MKNTLLFLIGCSLAYLSCNREPLPTPYDSVHNIKSPELTLQVKRVRVTKAEISCDVIKLGNLAISNHGFVWDTLDNPTYEHSEKIEMGALGTDTFGTLLQGLKQSRIYFIRAYVKTASDVYYSGIVQIMTLPQWEVFDNYLGGPVGAPAAFIIDSTLYVGGGIWNHNDLYAYVPKINKWMPREPFPGLGTWGLFGFSVDSLGYFGLGSCNCPPTKEFWKYSPQQNEWEKIDSFEGEDRSAGVSFVIGKKGYVGTGESNNVKKSDIWSYDTEEKKWEHATDFPDGGRTLSIAFVIDSKAYIGFGKNSQNAFKDDLWEYNPATDAWKKMDINIGRQGAFAFSLKNKGYIGGGVGLKDFWKFDPSEAPGKQWEQLDDLPTNGIVEYATAIAFSDFAIIIGGADGTDITKRVWKFNSDE